MKVLSTDVVMRKVGRTEQLQGSPKYRPISSISRRFQGYLDKAIKNRLRFLKEGSIEYDMRVVYDEAGGGTKGINAIIDSFKLEILEVTFISGNYKQDCKAIEHLEDFYMIVSDSLRPKGYNIATGSTGPHVSESSGGYGASRLQVTLDHLISHGWNMGDIAFYLRISVQQLDTIVRRAHEGKYFTIVQEELIENKMFELIEEGYMTPGQLADFFKGYGPNEAFAFLAKTKKGKEYLKSLITSLIIQNGYKNYDPLLKDLGLVKSRKVYAPGIFQNFM